jgi:hypothetical protein
MGTWVERDNIIRGCMQAQVAGLWRTAASEHPTLKDQRDRRVEVPYCRFSGNAMAFDGLSALTQLTRVATEYSGSIQHEALYGQLAQLTGLRELDAPMVLQTGGGARTTRMSMLRRDPRTSCAGHLLSSHTQALTKGHPPLDARAFVGSSHAARRRRCSADGCFNALKTS